MNISIYFVNSEYCSKYLIYAACVVLIVVGSQDNR